jgi:hypothetical protein
LCCIVGIGCKRKSNSAIAVENGKKMLSPVSEFESLFPHNYSFISYYSGKKGDPIWNSTAGIHGRYILKMKFKIKFDDSRTKPEIISPPEFYLMEVKSIKKERNGKVYAPYTPELIKFNEKQWKEIVKAKGDFSVIGYEMNTKSPIKGFYDDWKSF